jgi:cytochrome c oxidase subunit III
MADHSIEYGTTGKPHPYHLVRPSIWPLLSSLAAGLLAVGAVMYMHKVTWAVPNSQLVIDVGLKGVLLGFMSVIACMFFWWRDVVHESVVERAHSKIAEIGLRYGMALFIASEVMFFVAFFWAFFDVSLLADHVKQYLRLEYTKGVWPPPQFETIPAFELPFTMTLILLLSGSTVTWAHHAIQKGNMKSFQEALGYTIILGTIFLCFQMYEYSHVVFGFKDGAFASIFYMATGFHGLHVLIGTLFLIVCWFRGKAGHFSRQKHFGFEAAAWYWHFVDVVWLFLFVAIYWWGGEIGIGTDAAKDAARAALAVAQ